MKNRKCPMHKHCWDYKDNNCDNCDTGKCISRLHKKVDKLKNENKKLKAENEELKAKIDVLLNPNFLKGTKMDEHSKEYRQGYEQGVKDLADRIIKYYRNLKDNTYSGVVTFTIEVAMNELLEEDE